ncbi:MAG: glycine--tRNA ligase [Flavobacteriales bacterium]|nr:glycine--tRNA ligase [Flavobacteriales bacterium]
MNLTEDLLRKIVAHSKEYGFVFPSSEIYDGLSATYDYGQYGAELKNNLREYWWQAMVRMHENIVGIDAAIFMHPKTWKASGHVDAFNDPLIDNKDSKKRYRADVLLEEYMEKIRKTKIDKEIEKAAKRFGDAFQRETFIATHPRVLEYQQKIDEIASRMKKDLEDENFEDLRSLIIELGIVCPVSGTANWTEVRQFNLMFSTELGATAEDAGKIYLRPETCQGIFVNFLNVMKTARLKIPFGIAQTGKAFRNEIIARQFIFRMREFEQMEMQFFVAPGTEMHWYSEWKNKRLDWHKKLLPANRYRVHDHIKLAHYANAACDIEFDFPMGFKELEGIHSRTNFDLSQHEKFSGKKLQYFDPETNNSYIPYVIETSIGLDRLFLAVLTEAYCEEKLEDGSERTVLKIPAEVAPVKIAVFPLVKKDRLPEKAMEIFNVLKREFSAQYEEKDTIGKRYRRQDAIGTPFCITVDHQSLEDNTVTLRDRDTMQQERIGIPQLQEVLRQRCLLVNLL